MRRALALVAAFTLTLAALGCAGTSGVSGGDGARLHVGASGEPAVLVDEPGALSSLAAPEGVEPALWDMLTAELGRVLAERFADGDVDNAGELSSTQPLTTTMPLRIACTPPMGDASATVLSYSAGAATLSWRYYSHGDYNQDGLVSVSDLIPLGQHYGEGSPVGAGQPFPPASLGAVIDGNGDGLINLSDIITIGQNFGVRVAGYHVYASHLTYSYPAEPTEPNREGAMLLATVGMDAGGDNSERRRFFAQVVPTEEEQYYWVRPYDGEADGVASNMVDVLLPPNQPPLAVLLWYGAPRTPAHIRWDALASRDDDGDVVRYEWDFDGDGEFEYDSGDATQVSFYYYEAGQYTCALRVTDDEGATDTDATVVFVQEEATWHVNVVDTEIHPFLTGPNPRFKYVQLLDIEDMPSLFYVCTLTEPDPETDSFEKTVYLRALDAHGETWAERQWVPGSTGYEDALVVEGLPALMITRGKDYQSPPEPFKYEYWKIYMRAADATGASWPVSEVIANWRINSPDDWEGDRFDSIYKLLIIDSNPAIIGQRYTTELGTHVAFVRALDSGGSSWPSEYSLSDRIIYYPSSPIMSVDGELAFLNLVNGEDILYNRNQSVNDLDWAEPVLVDQLEQAGFNVKLLDANGFPAVVYYDELQSALKYRCARDAEGSAWGEPVVLSTAAAHYFNATIVDGRPTVIYSDRIDGQTKFIAANDGRGALWGLPSIAPGPAVGAPFVEVAGMPAYSYAKAHNIEDDDYETELFYGMYY